MYVVGFTIVVKYLFNGIRTILNMCERMRNVLRQLNYHFYIYIQILIECTHINNANMY